VLQRNCANYAAAPIFDRTANVARGAGAVRRFTSTSTV